MAAATLGSSNVYNLPASSWTPNVTPASGDLLVVFVLLLNMGLGSDDVTVTAGTNGISTFAPFPDINGSGCFGADPDDWRHYGFVAEQLSTGSSLMTLTVDRAGLDSASGAIVHIIRISGMSKAGTAAVRQSGINFGANGTTPTITFSSAALTTNLMIGSVTEGDTTKTTPPTNFTELSDVVTSGVSGGDMGMATSTRDSGHTSDTITWGATANAWRVTALELDTSVDTNPIAICWFLAATL